MKNIKVIELYDDIRNDAIILMKENPNLKYSEAFSMAKEELIGNTKISDFEFKPFNVEIDDNLNKVASKKEEKVKNEKVETEDDYYTSVKKKLSEYINVDDFSDEQIDEFNIALQMGVDITKYADNKFSPKQLKTLCLLVASGKDIDNYRYDYNFDPTKVMEEMFMKETKK